MVGMVPQNIQSGISNILRIDSIRKGVQVSSTEDGLVIDVHVIVVMGSKSTKWPTIPCSRLPMFRDKTPNSRWPVST